VAAIITHRQVPKDKYFLFVTRSGLVKRSSISLYQNVRSSGLIAVNLRDGDELLAVREVAPEDEMILVTRNGYSIRFNCEEVRATGRNTSGVKGIALRDGDHVVTGVVASADGKPALLTIAENGFGKRTTVEQFRSQSRGGMGIINMRITPKTGPVVGAVMVDDSDQVILLTSTHKIIRIGIKDVSLVGRATQGVRLVSLDSGQSVICFDLVQALVVDDAGDES
jgi:DNA gyrase subunit A